MNVTDKITKTEWCLMGLAALFLLFTLLLYPRMQETADYGSCTVTVSRSAPASVTPEAPALVDINRADAGELETLTGIGPALAQRITEYRKTHGPFRSIEDLLNVEGIGETTLEKFRDHVTCG